MDRLFLIRTNIPKPELTSRPAVNAPKERFPETNNSVNNNELAQLGINPTRQAYKGVRYLFVFKNALKASSPTPAITNPRIKLITKT